MGCGGHRGGGYMGCGGHTMGVKDVMLSDAMRMRFVIGPLYQDTTIHSSIAHCLVSLEKPFIGTLQVLYHSIIINQCKGLCVHMKG